MCRPGFRDPCWVARRKRFAGEMLTIGEPDWEPLERVLRLGVCERFMWMFAVKLSTGAVLQAYKHTDTRGYLHLDASGGAYTYCEADDRYRSIELSSVVAAVLRPLWHLSYLPSGEAEMCWAEVERISRAESPESADEE